MRHLIPLMLCAADGDASPGGGRAEAPAAAAPPDPDALPERDRGSEHDRLIHLLRCKGLITHAELADLLGATGKPLHDRDEDGARVLGRDGKPKRLVLKADEQKEPARGEGDQPRKPLPLNLEHNHQHSQRVLAKHLLGAAAEVEAAGDAGADA